ncbi:MAG TPA: hypothetical protein VGB92_01245 [Longimicrobium sp.]|jgi:hypothetical protein
MDPAPQGGPGAEPPPADRAATAAIERGLRAVLRWVDEGAAGVDPGAMAEWERELLLGSWDPGARLPLAVLARELAEPDGPEPERVAWACLCVTEWALESGAVAAGLAFAEAAARAWPDQGRYAWAAGRLLRAHGREEDAETWLRRAAQLAGRAGDWEGQARSLVELVRPWQDGAPRDGHEQEAPAI